MMRNQKGLGIIDLLIGLALMALLGGIISTTGIFITKQQTQIKNDLDDSIDTNLAERMLFKDLAGLEPSFNNINTRDDSGYGFFDYYPDVPANALRTPLTRVAELSVSRGRTEFFILVQDTSAGSLLNYEPPSAYDVGPAPDDFNQPATLTYRSINKDNWVAVQRPGFWQSGKLLMLDTPARVRRVTSSGVDMSVLPRSPIFVGSVQNNDLVFDRNVTAYINVAHPESGAAVDSVDTFFKDLPSVGGGQPLVRLRSVKLVRYYLEPYEDRRMVTTPSRLYMTEYQNGRFSAPFLMADKVDKVVFRRDSVLKRMMYFKLVKTQSKSKAGL